VSLGQEPLQWWPGHECEEGAGHAKEEEDEEDEDGRSGGGGTWHACLRQGREASLRVGRLARGSRREEKAYKPVCCVDVQRYCQ